MHSCAHTFRPAHPPAQSTYLPAGCPPVRPPSLSPAHPLTRPPSHDAPSHASPPLQANRKEIIAANPEASFTEVNHLISAAWKECSDKDKEPFLAQAANDKARAAKDQARAASAAAAASAHMAPHEEAYIALPPASSVVPAAAAVGWVPRTPQTPKLPPPGARASTERGGGDPSTSATISDGRPLVGIFVDAENLGSFLKVQI